MKVSIHLLFAVSNPALQWDAWAGSLFPEGSSYWFGGVIWMWWLSRVAEAPGLSLSCWKHWSKHGWHHHMGTGIHGGVTAKFWVVAEMGLEGNLNLNCFVPNVCIVQKGFWCSWCIPNSLFYYCNKGQSWKLCILAFQQLRSARVCRGFENHVVVWTCSTGSISVLKASVLVQVPAGRKLCAQRVAAAKNGCLKF